MTNASQVILAQSLKDKNNLPMATDRPSTPDRETSSHGESTSYDTVNEERKQTQKQQEPEVKSVTPKTSIKKHINRTSSRDRDRHRRSDSTNLYELSADIAEKAMECLEKKYGGKEKANAAARTIQESYRHWVMNKSFLRVRAYSGRRRSLTMPEKQFQKLKDKSLVFYGPENPVMIVDGEFERNNVEPLANSEEKEREQQDDEQEPEEKPNIIDLAKEEGMRMCSQSTVDSDDNDETTLEDEEEDEEKNVGGCEEEERKEDDFDDDGEIVDKGSSQGEDTTHKSPSPVVAKVLILIDFVFVILCIVFAGQNLVKIYLACFV